MLKTLTALVCSFRLFGLSGLVGCSQTSIFLIDTSLKRSGRGCSLLRASNDRLLFYMVPPRLLVISSGMGADRSSTARDFLTRPPTGTSRRAISPCEGLPNFPTCPGGSGQGCPLLCAIFSPSQKPRARRDALLSQASTVSPCAFCEQEGHLAAPPLLFCLPGML
jgi:hypothetical protein